MMPKRLPKEILVQLPHGIVYPKNNLSAASHAAMAYLFGKSASTRLPRRAHAPPTIGACPWSIPRKS